MAFVDSAKIKVKAGGGGKGCESHYRDLWMRYPKADGGDGGDGGSVIFVSDSHIQTLLDFRFKQHYQGQRGGHGSSKGSAGKDGKDIVLRVPVGTILLGQRDRSAYPRSELVWRERRCCWGGKGGIGNMRRKTVVPPTEGRKRSFGLNWKLIADVGLIGFPNAGKSTLISNVSKVRSKIASYPFTTKQPILGIVETDDFKFIMADLPGLIEGAHLGKGLGHQFLKHAERTKILVHVLDMAGTEERDPLDDYDKLNFELEAYSAELAHKHKIVVANKMDLPEAKKHIKRFRKKYNVDIFEVSAKEHEGLEPLIQKIIEILINTNKSVI